jgi:formylglycine-generating enzyme required for sulfatase activity
MIYDADNFILVKGGVFTMGDDQGDFSPGSRPLHAVEVGDFYLSKYQLDQRTWQAVMGNNPSNTKEERNPVEMVSWFDAVEFCNRLSAKEGLEACYRVEGKTVGFDITKNGYRLPTEAEWEYAARGGEEYLYSGSDVIEVVAWYKNNSGGTTRPAGTKAPNRLGLYDMSGNVWEWCWDFYGAYKAGCEENPAGPFEGNDRTARGGSWLDFAYGCTVGIRSRRNPSLPQCDVGFRLARSVL